MDDTWLFEIPVYRVSEDAWLDDVAARIDRWAEAHLRSQADHGLAITERDRLEAAMWARHAEKVYGWRYNEVIGWIGLLWDGPGPVIKAYLWQVATPTLTGWEPRRRYQRGFHPFPFLGGAPLNKLFEVWAHHDDSDTALYQKLRDELVAVVARDGDLPRRHIDLSAFENTGPHVRWRRLLGLDR